MFDFCSYITNGNVFLWAEKLKKKKKEGIEENCLTKFETLNLGLFADGKKLFWRLSFKISI